MQLALFMALGSWLILALTAPGMAMVWDEGEYLLRADRIIEWFGLLVDVGNPSGGIAALAPASIDEHWFFGTRAEGHPAWAAISIAVGKGLLSGVADPLTASRLGPVTVFSLACGFVAFRVKRDFGTPAALVTVASLLTLPRLFADAHYATQDAQLTAWWLILWAVDASARRTRLTIVSVGLVLGLTISTKFTGWLALVPLTLWRMWKGNRARLELLTIIPLALLTFYAVNPTLWHQPVDGMVKHFRLNLERPDINAFGVGGSVPLPDVWGGGPRRPVNVRDYLAGSMRYGGDHAYAPWYNTAAWVLLATPLPTFVLGCIGLYYCVRRARAPSGTTGPDLQVISLVLHWAMLMVVRALPGAPPNDGIRLILPAFGFWCVLAGIGAHRVWEAGLAARSPFARRRVVAGVLLAAFAAAAINEARYYPQTLSHYSVVVGGLRGAARLGLEPTYWWDALDDETLEWLNTHTEPGGAVGFSWGSTANLELLRRWGRLQPRAIDATAGVPFKWYVIQNRPSMLNAADRLLITSTQPAFVNYAGHHPRGVPADLNVPLLLVFTYEQYQRALLEAG